MNGPWSIRAAVITRFAALALGTASFLLPPAARAQASASPAPMMNEPCPGCVASIPPGDAPAPLLVLLHGDHESASRLFERWRPWTEPRGIAILSLACPTSEGCRGSWWRWNGDPEWIDHQIERLGERHPIDRERLWLVGWSGGASYVGRKTQLFERTFAAIIIAGGGVPPGLPGCAVDKSPIYFLVGDKNPLHHLVVGLRNHYETCGNDVRWNLLKGADHLGELAALDQSGGAIVDWLEQQRREPP